MGNPPHKTPRETITFSRVIWAFWLAIFVLGLPIWVVTTSIYRATLPIDQMTTAHDGVLYQFPICLHSGDVPSSELEMIARRTETALRTQADFVSFQVTPCSPEQFEMKPGDRLASIVRLTHGPSASFHWEQESDQGLLTYAEANLDIIANYLAGNLLDQFSVEFVEVSRILSSSGFASDKIRQYLDTTETLTSKSFKANPHYHLTFSLFSAGPSPSDWDAQAAIRLYIEPFLRTIAKQADISVTSQVQLYASLSASIRPQKTEIGWTLHQSDLTSFINTAEWPLSPSIGAGPTINFILYVPRVEHIPTHIGEDHSTSWLIPQYGAVTILNPTLLDQEHSELGLKVLPSYLDLITIQPAFENFRTQLLQLIGVPESSKLPLSERIRSFKRIQSFSLFLRTSSSLTSLARLEQHLYNIPIPKRVLTLVQDSLAGLSEYKAALNIKPLHNAFSSAEKAFFDKAMVGQVYFPDEHKVAVYLPLLGPIGVPLVIGLLRDIKDRLRRAKYI